MSEQKKLKISRNQIKWFAMITMAIDHFGHIFDSEKSQLFQIITTIMHSIGRIAFPLFCFLLVDGFLRTKSKKKYFFRLLMLAIMSEIPFNMMFERHFLAPTYQNTIWTLLLGFIYIWTISAIEKQNWYKKNLFGGLINLALAGVLTVIAIFGRTDYSAFGVWFIIIYYEISKRDCRLWKTRLRMGIIAYLCGCILLCFYSIDELAALPGLLLLVFYAPEKKEKPIPTWLGYGFYPMHILLIFLLSLILYVATKGLIGDIFIM